MNKHNEISAGFRWRTADRTTKRGNWLRDLAIALAVALAASILGMVGDAYAQSRSIQISGNNRTVMVTVPIGKSEDVRTDTSFVDVVVGDPEVADVNPLTDHALSILGKKIGTTRVSVYAEGKKLVGIFDVEVSYDITRLTNELRRRFPGSQIQASTRQRPHHAVGRGRGCGDARQGGDHRAPVRAGNHQFGIGDVAAAGDAGSAFHRDFPHRRPRTGRAVESLWRKQHHQYRQPGERRTICR